MARMLTGSEIKPRWWAVIAAEPKVSQHPVATKFATACTNPHRVTGS